jgi:hypothetical protein
MTDSPRPFRKRWERVQRVILVGHPSQMQEMWDWCERNGYCVMKYQTGPVRRDKLEADGRWRMDIDHYRMVGERPLERTIEPMRVVEPVARGDGHGAEDDVAQEIEWASVFPTWGRQ